MSKLFEKIMQKQINGFISNYLSPYLCGYRKGYNTQQALLALIEKWKKILDDKGYGSAVLMDLSKAFDTLNHGLLIAKLSAYGFEHDALKIIYSYLTNRLHRTKLNSAFSSWEELTQGVPQGSVFGPLLFDIYLNDLFYLSECTKVCNFADDTTFYACDKDLRSLINRLEHDSLLAIEWFENNHMKLNQEKCHLLVSGYKHENIWARIGQTKIWESRKQNLLGVEIDSNLNFDLYVSSLCKKAGENRNIQSLAIELFKVKQNLSNSMLSNIFPTRSISYNLRSQTDIIRSNASTSQYGLNSMRCFASKVWQMIPVEIKNSVSIESFKEKIRKWEPSSCYCRLCMPYIHNLGYVNNK